jgi:hypothetical protein
MTILEVLKKQLETEKQNACERLTSANLDAIFKLTSSIKNLECIDARKDSSAVDNEILKKYSNGRYDHNIDALYDAYLSAKQTYQSNGDQGHRDKLMESVGRLMTEIYDLLSCMMMDADFKEEKDEIKRSIRKLADM